MPLLTHEQVHEGLRNLCEPVGLCASDLAAAFPEIGGAGVEEHASQLSPASLQAIEALRPSRRHPFGSLESRSCDALTLRYVEGMSIRQMADELSLSARQVHRDLWTAEDRPKAVLNSQPAPQASGPSDQPNPLEDELTYLRTQPGQVCLEKVPREALDLVRPLLAQLGRQVEMQPVAGRVPHVVADRAALKQLLAQLVSRAAQAASGPLNLSVSSADDSVTASAAFRLSNEGALRQRLADAERMAEALGCRLVAAVTAMTAGSTSPGSRHSPVATSNPDMSGSTRSRYTTDGRGWRALRRASPPLQALSSSGRGPGALSITRRTSWTKPRSSSTTRTRLSASGAPDRSRARSKSSAATGFVRTARNVRPPSSQSALGKGHWISGSTWGRCLAGASALPPASRPPSSLWRAARDLDGPYSPGSCAST